VAVAITNIQGPVTNKSLGLPSAADQQASYQAVINAQNAAGGVACRKLVPDYIQINPADPSDLQSKCLQVEQAGVFALLDGGGAGGAAGSGTLCYTRAHIPFFGGLNLATASQVNSSKPYLFGISATYDAMDHTAIFALRDRGFYNASNGFKKLGVMEAGCDAALPGEVSSWLNQVGVPSSQVVSFNFGCPNGGIYPPSSYQQAELKFQQNGVTNVTSAGMAGWPYLFTKVAQQQGYHPKYGWPDENMETILQPGNVADAPDYANIADAVLVTTGAFGEEHTSGMTPTATTAKCNTIMQSAGLPSVYQRAQDGQTCDEVWMFAAAASHAPTLSRDALAAGLQAAKSVDFSFPMGPNDFSGHNVTMGGQYWRILQFTPSCNCWRVVDPTYHPPFPSSTNLS
jgi:hypothetical protein